MAGVPYTFGTATTSIPLSQLDADFNTPVTIGSTTVGLGNTVTSLAGLSNVTTTNAIVTNLTLGGTQNQQIGQGNASTLKNRIINGAMVIDQRYAGASVTPTGSAYLVDRWEVILTQSSKLSFQQNAGSVTPPVGFTNYLGATSTSAYSLVTNDYFLLTQKIEGFNSADLGWGTANAKTVTVSFQAYSSLTGTFGFILRNYAGNRVYPASYSIPVANTWTTISVTVAGDTSGTWIGATNGVGIELDFGLGVASNISASAGAWTTSALGTTGATSVVGTNGATFYITGVQLEVGSSATGYEYRQYGQELALCQRYCQQVLPADLYSYFGMFGATAALSCSYSLKTTMRTTPSVTTPTFSTTNCGTPTPSNYTANSINYSALASGIGNAIFQNSTTALATAEL